MDKRLRSAARRAAAGDPAAAQEWFTEACRTGDYEEQFRAIHKLLELQFPETAELLKKSEEIRQVVDTSSRRWCSSPIYDNCGAYSPDNKLLFYCNEDKRDWYISRGLAEAVNDKDFKLLFEPAGDAHASDPYFLMPKKNVCVVCGTDQKLTHHHVFPLCYKRHIRNKSAVSAYGMYDVMAVCVTCHDTYESYADEFKREIATRLDEDFNIDHSAFISNQAAKHAVSLRLFGSAMPEERRKRLEALVIQEFGSLELPLEVYEQAGSNRHPSKIAQMMHRLAQTGDLNGFVVRWRKHFVTTMSPRFLPENWEVEREIY